MNIKVTATIVELRKVCDCGYEKSMEFLVDKPYTQKDLRLAIKRSKQGFSPHNHPTSIKEKIVGDKTFEREYLPSKLKESLAR